MGSVVDVVVRLLEDGKPHSIGEIMKEEGIPRKEVDRVIRFLTKYDIAERVGGSIKIDPEFRSLAKVDTSRTYLPKKPVR